MKATDKLEIGEQKVIIKCANLFSLQLLRVPVEFPADFCFRLFNPHCLNVTAWQGSARAGSCWWCTGDEKLNKTNHNHSNKDTALIVSEKLGCFSWLKSCICGSCVNPLPRSLPPWLPLPGAAEQPPPSSSSLAHRTSGATDGSLPSLPSISPLLEERRSGQRFCWKQTIMRRRFRLKRKTWLPKWCVKPRASDLLTFSLKLLLHATGR